MMIIAFLLMPLFLAFSYRARGGAIPLGSTTLARILFWGLPIGACSMLICLAWGLPLWLGAFAAVCAFLAACIGHACAQGNGPAAYDDMACIIFKMCFLQIAPFIVYLGYHGNVNGEFFVLSILLVLLTPFACRLGYKIRNDLVIFNRAWCTAGDSSWEEFLIGLLPFGLLYSFLGLAGLYYH